MVYIFIDNKKVKTASNKRFKCNNKQSVKEYTYSIDNNLLIDYYNIYEYRIYKCFRNGIEKGKFT